MVRVFLGWELQRQDQLVEDAVQNDLAECAAKRAEKVLQASLSPDLTEFFRLMRPLTESKKFCPNRSCCLQDEAGQVLLNIGDIQAELREHFSRLVGGKVQSCVEIVAAQRIMDAQGAEQVALLDKYLAAIPAPSRVARNYGSMKSMLGLGEDGIGSEVVRRLPVVFAQLFAPVVLKAGIRVSPLLQSKGGRTIALRKGNGKIGTPMAKAHRDITAQDAVIKGMTRVWRTDLREPVNKIAMQTQFGCGMWRAGTDFVTFTCRL